MVIIAGMNATDERRKKVDFTTVYTRTPISVIGAENGGLDGCVARRAEG
jgi:polar amino acid transport system substrate-binding protein